jgi:hypothetical protein
VNSILSDWHEKLAQFEKSEQKEADVKSWATAATFLKVDDVPAF